MLFLEHHVLRCLILLLPLCSPVPIEFICRRKISRIMAEPSTVNNRLFYYVFKENGFSENVVELLLQHKQPTGEYLRRNLMAQQPLFCSFTLMGRWKWASSLFLFHSWPFLLKFRHPARPFCIKRAWTFHWYFQKLKWLTTPEYILNLYNKFE